MSMDEAEPRRHVEDKRDHELGGVSVDHTRRRQVHGQRGK